LTPQKIVIIYASRYGQTAKVAERIASTLRGSHQVLLLPAGESAAFFDPRSCEGVIVAGSVHFGRHQRSIRQWVRQHAIILATLPSAFVSVSGAGGSPVEEGKREARRYVDEFLADAAWSPRKTAIFGGSVPYTRYGFFVRWFMKRLAVKRGRDYDTTRDYEYTDWDAVEQFARDFLQMIEEGRKIA
jgi:menaquinone-dependent protoporphyrinogen oxidase